MRTNGEENPVQSENYIYIYFFVELSLERKGEGCEREVSTFNVARDEIGVIDRQLLQLMTTVCARALGSIINIGGGEGRGELKGKKAGREKEARPR